MSIFYDDGNAKNGKGDFKYYAFNANGAWIGHQYNRFILNLIAQRSDDRNERCQALKELPIAERKIAYAERHPNFNEDHAKSTLFREYKIRA
jgi:hypothetical protein